MLRARKFRDGKVHDQAALFHQRDAIGQQQSLAQIVGNKDHRLLHALLQGAKFFLHLRSRDRIERAESLVENQNRRIGRQSPRHAYALPLASGELAGIARRQVLTRARPCASNSRTRACTRACGQFSIRGTSAMLRSTVKCGNRPPS